MNKISIVIPFYNADKYLENSINSVLNQFEDNFELLLIDDGSTDNSKNICIKYVDDVKIKYYYQENSGVSSARNNGISNSNGDYIFFMDADDSLEPDFYETIKNILGRYQFIAFNHYIINMNKKCVKNSVLDNCIIEKNDIYYMLNDKHYFCGYVWNKIYDLNIIKKNNLNFDFNIHILEDLYFNINYTKYVDKMYYLRNPIYNYYIRNTSSLNNFKNMSEIGLNKKLSEFVAIDKILDFYKANVDGLSFLIKKRYIQTTYKFYYIFQKNKFNRKLLNNYIIKSKIYYNDVKRTLPFFDKVKMILNIKLPYIYGCIGNKIRKE